MSQWMACERHLADAEATRAMGHALGERLRTTDQGRPLLITLNGELGAGKTTLVSGLMSALGFNGSVRSPTYTLIEPYELAGRQLFHLDLYRLTAPSQLEELGVRDLMLPGAVLLVEWAQRAGELLTHPDLAVNLSYPKQGTDGRYLLLQPHTESGARLIASLAC